MIFDLDGSDRPDAYKLLTTLVTPRPIALVSTISEAGVANAAPFSFFNVLGSKPPIVGFCPGNRSPGIPKDTARNIRESKEFVVNLVDEAIVEKMHRCAEPLGPEESEFEHVGFTPKASERIKPPRISEAPVSLECEEWGTLQIGDNRLVIGKVLLLHVRDGILDQETLRLQPDTYHSVGRMPGAGGYARTRDQFEL